MSTNPIVANAIARSTIEAMQRKSRTNFHTDNSAVRNREEGVGRLTAAQQAAKKLWKRDSYSHEVFSIESRVRIKGAL